MAANARAAAPDLDELLVALYLTGEEERAFLRETARQAFSHALSERYSKITRERDRLRDQLELHGRLRHAERMLAAAKAL
jgi:hypothetical protein